MGRGPPSGANSTTAVAQAAVLTICQIVVYGSLIERPSCKVSDTDIAVAKPVVLSTTNKRADLTPDSIVAITTGASGFLKYCVDKPPDKPTLISIFQKNWGEAQEICPGGNLCLFDQLCDGLINRFPIGQDWGQSGSVWLPISDAPDRWVQYGPGTKGVNKNLCKTHPKRPTNDQQTKIAMCCSTVHQTKYSVKCRRDDAKLDTTLFKVIKTGAGAISLLRMGDRNRTNTWHYCNDYRGKLTCDFQYCIDTYRGVTDVEKGKLFTEPSPGHTPEWEKRVHVGCVLNNRNASTHFEVVPAGAGSIALRGATHNKLCIDEGTKVSCTKSIDCGISDPGALVHYTTIPECQALCDTMPSCQGFSYTTPSPNASTTVREGHCELKKTSAPCFVSSSVQFYAKSAGEYKEPIDRLQQFQFVCMENCSAPISKGAYVVDGIDHQDAEPPKLATTAWLVPHTSESGMYPAKTAVAARIDRYLTVA